MGAAQEVEAMTQKEAQVLRAALRFWRASNGLDPLKPGEINLRPDEIEVSKEILLEACGEAVNDLKEWVFLRQTENPNEPELVCRGCSGKETVRCPLPIEQVVAINTAFRAKHLDCGPVAEEIPAGT